MRFTLTRSHWSIIVKRLNLISKSSLRFNSQSPLNRVSDLVGNDEDAQQSSLTSFVDPPIKFDGQPWTNTCANAASQISGEPLEHLEKRTARIFMPAKSSTQSATNDIHVWKIELDARKRWESPLIGWCSNSDPLSNIAMAMQFESADAAAKFCEKKGWDYEIIQPQTVQLRSKSYADNFSWNKRTRCKFRLMQMTADQKYRKSAKPAPTIDMILHENSQLISSIVALQSKGKLHEAERYHQALHRNLLHLAQMASTNGHPEHLAKLQAPFEDISCDLEQTSSKPYSQTVPLDANVKSVQQEGGKVQVNDQKLMRNRESVMQPGYVDPTVGQVGNVYAPSMIQQQMAHQQYQPNVSPLQQQLQGAQAPIYAQYNQEQHHRQQQQQHQQQQQQQHQQQQQQQQQMYSQQQHQQQPYVQMVRPGISANDGSYYAIPNGPSYAPRPQYAPQHHENAFGYQNPPTQQPTAMPPGSQQSYMQQQRPDGYGQPMAYDAVQQQQRQYASNQMMAMPVNPSQGQAPQMVQPNYHHQPQAYHHVTYGQQNATGHEYLQERAS